MSDRIKNNLIKSGLNSQQVTKALEYIEVGKIDYVIARSTDILGEDLSNEITAAVEELSKSDTKFQSQENRSMLLLESIDAALKELSDSNSSFSLEQIVEEFEAHVCEVFDTLGILTANEDMIKKFDDQLKIFLNSFRNNDNS